MEEMRPQGQDGAPTLDDGVGVNGTGENGAGKRTGRAPVRRLLAAIGGGGHRRSRPLGGFGFDV